MSTYFTKSQQIKFKHCDAAGIVFYPRFFEMLNDLVEDWFQEALHLPFSKLHEYGGIPTAHITINFKNPAILGDIIQKKLIVTELKNKSLTYQFEFTKNQTLILEGKAVLVYVTNQGNGNIQSTQWSEELKQQIQKYCLE